MTKRRLRPVAIAAICVASLALAQSNSAENWVTTWTTAQQLVAPTGPPRPARQKGPEASNLPASFSDQTVRMVAHVSVGGRRVRVELSNMLNAQPLEIGAAHLATAKVSDPWFSAKDTIDYYQRMTTANGGASKVTDWSRLFLSPGMGHCGGGSATLDNFDMLSAAVNWVEKNQAPESVMATGRDFPGRSRPLCAYPAHAQYNGSGNPEDGANYSCRQ